MSSLKTSTDVVKANNMKPLIQPSFYFGEEVFKKEQVVLFQKLWNFIGFTIEVENHNDYLCKEIGGKSIVIQNFQGELKAFNNVCTHRFSRIRQDSQGNASLQCPYHGWIFNKEGIPITIPHQLGFNDMSSCVRESLKLEEWLVETCGVFIFVKRFDDNLSLKDYLGDMYDQLVDFSEAIGQKVECYEMTLQANWKVIIENTLDSYHVWAVHPNTLGKHGPVEEHCALYGSHSTYLSKPKKLDAKLRKFVSNFSDRKLTIDGYQHYIVFPMLTMSTMSGMSLSVHSLTPISPSETLAKNYTFMGNLNDSRLEEILFKMNSQASAELVRKVWDEDKPICEQVQLGMHSVESLGGIFNHEEQRVYEFQKTYLNFMKC